MRNYVVSYGQSIYDIAVQQYGDLSRVWDIIDDNNLSDGLDADLEGGQVLRIREGVEMTANGISEYFVRYPSIVNNSDYEDVGLISVLKIILKKISSENHGGDGYILIDVTGGKPGYLFQWFNQDTENLISTSQNLVSVPGGTYRVTVVDSEGTEVSLNNLTIAIADNTVYLVDDNGNFVTDEFGNYIVVS